MYDGSKAAKRELRKQVLARRDALAVSERIEKSLAMADAVARPISRRKSRSSNHGPVRRNGRVRVAATVSGLARV